MIAVLLSGLFSGSEIAFVQSSKVRREIDAAKGGLVNRILQSFSHHEDMFISSLLVGNNVVLVIYGIAFSAIVNPVLEGWFGHDSEALVLVGNTILEASFHWSYTFRRRVPAEDHVPHQSEFHDAYSRSAPLRDISCLLPGVIARIGHIKRSDADFRNKGGVSLVAVADYR